MMGGNAGGRNGGCVMMGKSQKWMMFSVSRLFPTRLTFLHFHHSPIILSPPPPLCVVSCPHLFTWRWSVRVGAKKCKSGAHMKWCSILRVRCAPVYRVHLPLFHPHPSPPSFIKLPRALLSVTTTVPSHGWITGLLARKTTI